MRNRRRWVLEQRFQLRDRRSFRCDSSASQQPTELELNFQRSSYPVRAALIASDRPESVSRVRNVVRKAAVIRFRHAATVRHGKLGVQNRSVWIPASTSFEIWGEIELFTVCAGEIEECLAMARRVGPVSVVVDSATVERFLNFVIIRQKFENYEEENCFTDHKCEIFPFCKDFFKFLNVTNSFDN